MMNKERDYKKENKRLSIFNWIYLLLIAFLIIFLPYYSSKHPSRLYNVPDEVIFNAIYAYKTNPCEIENIRPYVFGYAKKAKVSYATYNIRPMCNQTDIEYAGKYWVVYDEESSIEYFCRNREKILTEETNGAVE